MVARGMVFFRVQGSILKPSTSLECRNCFSIVITASDSSRTPELRVQEWFFYCNLQHLRVLGCSQTPDFGERELVLYCNLQRLRVPGPRVRDAGIAFLL